MYIYHMHMQREREWNRDRQKEGRQRQETETDREEDKLEPERQHGKEWEENCGLVRKQPGKEERRETAGCMSLHVLSCLEPPGVSLAPET